MLETELRIKAWVVVGLVEQLVVAAETAETTARVRKKTPVNLLDPSNFNKV
jgi:putative AlgH/UPF0301 family transcriptional regulator